MLLRPSYVIGGQNMTIAGDEEDTRKYMERILENSDDNTVLVDKYMPGIELEVDVISDGEDVLIPGIMEHIEKAGIHSGDSIAVYPPFNLSDRQLRRIVDISENWRWRWVPRDWSIFSISSTTESCTSSR